MKYALRDFLRWLDTSAAETSAILVSSERRGEKETSLDFVETAKRGTTSLTRVGLHL